VVAEDGLILRVLRQEPGVAVPLPERFDCGLVIQQGCHNVAVDRVTLPADHNPVAVADGGVDHGVAGHLQHKELTVANQLPWQRHHVLHHLVSQDGAACGDPADQGDHGRVGCGGQFGDGQSANSAQPRRLLHT
jgi:hypothetical protein